jgi:chitin disaccharide deacetylase
MTAIGARFGLRATRIPLEPAHVLRAIEPRTSGSPTLLTTPFALLLRRRASKAGLLAADCTFGLRWSGQMTEGRLSGLIRHLPDGLSEIYLHPATAPFSGAAPGYRYREEFDALMAAGAAAACRDSDLKLGGFGDFLDSQPTLRAGASHAATPAGGWMP